MYVYINISIYVYTIVLYEYFYQRMKRIRVPSWSVRCTRAVFSSPNAYCVVDWSVNTYPLTRALPPTERRGGAGRELSPPNQNATKASSNPTIAPSPHLPRTKTPSHHPTIQQSNQARLSLLHRSVRVSPQRRATGSGRSLAMVAFM